MRVRRFMIAVSSGRNLQQQLRSRKLGNRLPRASVSAGVDAPEEGWKRNAVACFANIIPRLQFGFEEFGRVPAPLLLCTA